MDPFATRDLGYAMGSAVGAIYLLGVLPYLLLSLAIPYAILRLNNRSDPPDTQVGFKCALFFAFSLGILMMLTGLTIFVVDLLVQTRDKSTADHLANFKEPLRSASALIMAGFVFTFFHLILILGFSNLRRYPEARRVFVGWRLAVHTLVVLAAFTALTILLFRENPDLDHLKAPLGILAVWMPSWILHLVLLQIYPTGMMVRPALARRHDEDEE